MIAVGIDIGGTTTKGGLVDTASGALIGGRQIVPTPAGCGPEVMAQLILGVIDRIAAGPGTPVGIGFPGPILHGTIMTTTHLADSWRGCDAVAFFGERLARRCAVINDADAAGLAEMRFGAGRGSHDTTLMLTLGTGIGSALFVGGRLVPNLELGHLEIDGVDAETRAAARVRELERLDWPEWAARLEHYLQRVDALVWPDVIILGGEITQSADRFVPLLSVRPRLVIAGLRNAAGVVGAAMTVAGVA